MCSRNSKNHSVVVAGGKLKLNYSKIFEHYLKPEIQSEIVEYCGERWIGILCDKTDERGRKILVRYGKLRKPLTINSIEDFKRLITRYRRLMPRSIYATANLYGKLEREEDIATIDNIIACTPTWDVDNRLEDWDATREAVREILRFLEFNGVSESVSVKFSGRGAHVQIHPYALSREIRVKHNPLDLAYALVEYVRIKLQPKIVDFALKFKAENLRVDNEIDPQRLFVCPLSVHKELYTVAVFLDPNRLEEFNPQEAVVGKVKSQHGGWRNYKVGEADELALKAYQTVGGYPGSYGRPRRRRHPSLDRQIISFLKKI
jgi:hypothetical protein